MYILENKIVFEHTINRSRFITYLFPITSVDEANDNLKEIRKRHYDATHNCYAYILGERGDVARSSDDGEPAGTAGIVIFDVLKKNKLTNILAIVTRYFGGIKLGAGGLIRAYGGSVAKALEGAKVTKLERMSIITLMLDYTSYSLIEKKLEEFNQLEKKFAQNVIIKLELPLKKKKRIINELMNITGGNIKII